MKKIAIALLLVAIFALASGCSSGSKPAEINLAEPGYSCRCDITYKGGVNATALLEVTGGGIFSAEVVSPETIKGLKFLFDNGEMSVEYGKLTGISGVVAEYGGFSEILDGIFLKIATDSSVAKLQGKEYVYEGKSDGYSFTVTVNEKGFPLKLSVPTLGFSAIFSDWQY